MKSSEIGFPITLNSRFTMSVLHFTIFSLLLFGYEYYIIPIYGYEGYFFEPNQNKYFFALVLLIIMSLLTPVDSRKPSTLFLNLSFVVVLIPMLVIFCADNKPWSYTFQSVIAYFVIIFTLPLIKAKYLKLPSFDNNELLNALLALCALYVVCVFAMGGGSYFNLDISKVYEFRTEAEESLAGIFGYISPLIGKVLLPFTLLLSLISRRYFSALLSIVLSVIVFGLTAHKGPLFYPLFIIIIYALLSNKNLLINISLISIVVLGFSIVDFMFLNVFENPLFGWFGSLTMRRMFIVPASINYMYYDFFSVNDFIFWSDSKLTMGLFEYPYSLDASHLIGLEYFNSEVMGANTGWLGSGYMQAGFISILLYALIIAITFSYIDRLATMVYDKKLVIAGTFVPIITLITSSDLPTAFLTHGLLINLLLIGLLKRQDECRADRSS